VATRVGINGFGRIGRQVFKAIFDAYEEELEIVAVNDLTDNDTLAHLLRYDSTYGIYDAEITATGDSISIDGSTFKAFSERDPAALPWGALGVDIVVESTGIFRDAAGAGKHIAAGAKKVIITAPASSSWASTTMTTIQTTTTSSPMPHARPTASRPWRRWSISTSGSPTR